MTPAEHVEVGGGSPYPLGRVVQFRAADNGTKSFIADAPGNEYFPIG